MSPLNTTIFSAFAIHGDLVDHASYGSGHINDTVKAKVNQAGTAVNYLFQRINKHIFKDIPGLMENIRRVTDHAQRNLFEQGIDDASRRALTLIPTRDGLAYHVDGDGCYWRCYLFIEGASGYDVVETPNQAFEAAKAFGEFQSLLVDLPGERLHETIPNFHNTPKRLDILLSTIEADRCNRASGVKAEIDWVMANQHLANALLSQHEAGAIPERVTHNDTKLNNVLIDDVTQKAACVIDLDTLMPGLALYDFGDLVRTSTSPVAEDEVDVSLIVAQDNMFEALVKGYLSAAGVFLTQAEVDSLPLSGQVITFECGIRFLTDYLQGDTYFKVKRDGHNLDRCRSQFALVRSLQQKHDAFMAMVDAAAQGA